TLLIIALARPTLWEPDEHLAVALVVDQSDSMTGVVKTAADQWLQAARAAARPNDRVATVRFGRQAVADGPNGGPAQVDGTASNLEAAVRLAGDMLPPTGERRVVVVSDGWENVGEAERAALDAARTGLAVAYAGLEAAADAPEVAVRAVETPDFVRDGASFETVVVVDSTVATDATVRLSIDGRQAAVDTVGVAAGTSRLTLPLRARGEGARLIHAEIVPKADTRADNNSADAFTVVKAPGAALVLEGHPGDGAALADALRDGGLQVDLQAPTA